MEPGPDGRETELGLTPFLSSARPVVGSAIMRHSGKSTHSNRMLIILTMSLSLPDNVLILETLSEMHAMRYLITPSTYHYSLATDVGWAVPTISGFISKLHGGHSPPYGS